MEGAPVWVITAAEVIGRAEARRLATNALARVRERFDPEQVASRYEELFLRLRFPLTNALLSG